MSVLIDVLTGLPLLHYMRLDGSGGHSPRNIIESESGMPAARSFPQNLRSLEICIMKGVELLFGWVLSLPVLPMFESLLLDVQVDSGVTPLEVYLQRAGGGIESLTLALWPFGRFPAFVPNSRIILCYR